NVTDVAAAGSPLLCVSRRAALPHRSAVCCGATHSVRRTRIAVRHRVAPVRITERNLASWHTTGNEALVRHDPQPRAIEKLRDGRAGRLYSSHGILPDAQRRP